jgi:mono/diheme cytochrome c family protein
MSTRLAHNRGRTGVLLLCLSGVTAVHAGDPPAGSAAARGESIARMVCSACHVVASDQPPGRLPAEAPRFSEIANRPGTNEQALRKFIATTHWDMKSVPVTMPNPMLTDEQVRDVSRYILSLRSPPPANSQ